MDPFAPLPHIDAALRDAIDRAPLPVNLREAAAYAALGPGKRLRPILAWHVCEAFGTPGEASVPAGIASEFIHAFSLVHDDLPALDNDDLRRGRPTTHKQFGEAMGILTGDLLLTLAFDVITSQVSDRATAGLLCAELAQGTRDMISGQVLDTLGGFDAASPPSDRVRHVHTLKTGALIRAACRMGAILSGDPARATTITPYADSIGLMFQIVDDLIDVEQSAEHTGKATGKDAAAGKLTYPEVFGIERSRQIATDLGKYATEHLQQVGTNTAPLIQLAEIMAKRTK
ncbi:MAG: polyprenyl synthetase family protein [Planctomycetes bacterium]|nr:polyprenyl synthetase family protein [Planctomycetota bacterium]